MLTELRNLLRKSGTSDHLGGDRCGRDERADRAENLTELGCRPYRRGPARFGRLPGPRRRSANLLPGYKQNPLKAVAGAVEAQLEGMERELLWNDPTPLDQMLVAYVVKCWLRVHRLRSQRAGSGRGPLRAAELYDRALRRRAWVLE